MPGRALRAACVAGALLLAPAGPGRTQDLKRPEEQLAAIYSLKVQLEIEQKQLDDALQRHGEIARAREEARARVIRFYQDLDAMVEGRQDGDADTIRTREEQILKGEQEVASLAREGQEIRAIIRQAHERISILKDHIRRLRRTLPSDTESLTGAWNVTYLPSNDKGVFTLRQSGTLLAGEYSLEGGWKGSLQGTLVDGKVLLHRIDSKLGRSSDLEGNLSPDGKTLRGTWQNYILSGGTPTTGSWVARKSDERSEP
jgi:hypothetical protein